MDSSRLQAEDAVAFAAVFRSHTVLVVGAGASCEAGLPSGDKLKEDIARLLDFGFDAFGNQHYGKGDSRIVKAFKTLCEAPDTARERFSQLVHGAWRIRDVIPDGAISIDNFLDAHRNDAELVTSGKLAIVKSILDAEAGSKLKSYDHSGRFRLSDLRGTWYIKLLHMMTENVSKEAASRSVERLSIITFNYDRCIERFLPQALSDYFDISDEEACELVRQIPIFHPYGSIGPLPWQAIKGHVSYGDNDHADLNCAAGRIKTFTEGLADEAILEPMHSVLEAADRIVFLGFAFHPINMKVLTPPNACAARDIFATTLNLSKADEIVIEDDIFEMLGRRHDNLSERMSMQPEMANMECFPFFQQYFRSLSAEARN
jgi:hypothetical protein